ncbi:MAG: hypothetical protein DMG24_14245, partial [Acidobacteria bacterium]
QHKILKDGRFVLARSNFLLSQSLHFVARRTLFVVAGADREVATALADDAGADRLYGWLRAGGTSARDSEARDDESTNDI